MLNEALPSCIAKLAAKSCIWLGFMGSGGVLTESARPSIVHLMYGLTHICGISRTIIS